MKKKVVNILAKLIVRFCTILLFLWLFLGLFSLFSCKGSESVTEARVKDSVRVEYRTEYVEDTVHYTMPYIHDAVMTLDTTSTLENKYAQSYAAIVDGYLYHTLDVKGQDIEIPVKTRVEYRDSIVYKDKSQTNTIYKYRDNWPMSAKITLFIMMMLMVALASPYIKKIYDRTKIYSERQQGN